MAFVTLHQDNSEKTEITVNTDHIVLMERTSDESTLVRFATSADRLYVIEAPHVIAAKARDR